MKKRRHHTKSRLGCQGCKRRHVKCDEIRPTCGRCSLTESTCVYETPRLYVARQSPTPDSTVAFSPEDFNRTATTSEGPFSLHAVTPSGFQDSTPSWLSTSTSTSPATSSTAPIAGCQPLNMRHMELISHFILEGPSILGTGTPAHVMMHSALPIALSTPYLMHEILAISALHLSHTRAHEADTYREEATALQTQALSMFNDSIVDITPSNCVPMLLYTSLLGLHALADAVKGLTTDEEGFLDNFIMYLNLHRGVRAVTQQSWDILKQSNLSLVLNSAELAMGAANSNNQDHANSVTSLLYNLLGHSDMGTDSKTACREAVARLQLVYEAQLQGEGSCGKSQGRSDLIWAWPVLLSVTFIELLVRRQSEALVILCHYAVLLHEHRGSWIVGDAGKTLISAITRFLGSYWRRWLELPYQVLAEPT